MSKCCSFASQLFSMDNKLFLGCTLLSIQPKYCYWYCKIRILFQCFFSVSLILGPVESDGRAGSLSSIADTGGLVASGDGTAAGNPKDVLGPLLKPRFGKLAGGGLVAVPDEVDGTGAAPLLNSAQRGHLRLVSRLHLRKPSLRKLLKMTHSCDPSGRSVRSASVVGDPISIAKTI